MTEDDKSIATKIKNNGWLQGSVLSVDKENIFYKEKILPDTGLYIVVSQSCDVVSDNFTLERIYTAISSKCRNVIKGTLQRSDAP